MEIFIGISIRNLEQHPCRRTIRDVLLGKGAILELKRAEEQAMNVTSLLALDENAPKVESQRRGG
jgi:hypothetical protein